MATSVCDTHSCSDHEVHISGTLPGSRKYATLG